MGVTQRAAPQLVGLADSREIERIINDELRKAFARPSIVCRASCLGGTSESRRRLRTDGQAAVEGMRPDPELRCDEWAEEFMKLPQSGPKPGEFRFDHSYPARRVHQVLSLGHPLQTRGCQGRVADVQDADGAQLDRLLIHRRPRNILALEPTDTLVKRFSARVSTMIRNVPELAERVAAAKSRDSRNTVQAKDFLGDATLYMNTAGSAANLAEGLCPLHLRRRDRPSGTERRRRRRSCRVGRGPGHAVRERQQTSSIPRAPPSRASRRSTPCSRWAPRSTTTSLALIAANCSRCCWRTSGSGATKKRASWIAPGSSVRTAGARSTSGTRP